MARVGPFNLKPIESAAKGAVADLAFLYGRKCTEVQSEPGAFSSTAEDMVDTGAFRASQRVERISDTEWQLSWTVDYAIYLWAGWTTRSGTRVEGREWDQEAARRLDVQRTFEMLLRAKL